MNQLIEKEIARDYKYRGRIINVRVDRIVLENGKQSEREVVEHNGAVAVLPVDADGNCTLVEQFRKPIEKTLLEAPAGKLDYGENPIACAQRELKEETGLTTKTLIPLGSIFTTAGFSDEKIYLFLAFDLEQNEPNPDEDEFVNTVIMKWSKLLQLSQENQIEDAKTNVLILRALSKVKKYLTDK